MNSVAVSVDHLSKLYRIGAFQDSNKTLRDTLRNRFAQAFRRRTMPDGHPDFIWALKDLSFQIEPGEIVGILGRNGAGKSTLLKVLSRITEPTEGHVEIHGRLGTLLEIGTGFHPELSGRENIFLSGAILGMSRADIQDRFDEIVSFSEIEKFIDTPVKHYSSGMYVRLAFAVAAHMDPDILLVDEVLAVGDLAFQKKCLGKMGDDVGRTVLFVSHQMNAIRKLCRRCIWLDGGRIRMIDTTAKVVGAYEAEMVAGGDEQAPEDSKSWGRFLGWEILEPRGEQPNILSQYGPVKIRLNVRVNRPLDDASHGVALYGGDQQLMWAWAAYRLKLEPAMHSFVYSLPMLPLRPGVYSLHVSISNEGKLLDQWSCIPNLIIATQPLGHPRDEWAGVLNLPCDFKITTGGNG